MSARTDHERIRSAAALGVPVDVICRRLGISARTVRRAVGTLAYDVNVGIGTEEEPRLWSLYHNVWGYPIATVAYRFLVSRQHISKTLALLKAEQYGHA